MAVTGVPTQHGSTCEQNGYKAALDSLDSLVSITNILVSLDLGTGDKSGHLTPLMASSY